MKPIHKQIGISVLVIALLAGSFFAGRQFIQNTNSALAAGAYNASSVLGQTDSTGTATFTENFPNNGSGLTGLDFSSDFPSNIVLVDGTYHRLFVSDNGNQRILVFNLGNDNLLLDRSADYVLGQSSLTSVTLSEGGGPNQIVTPGGLAFDATRNYLFVSDSALNRVLVFDVASITNGEDAIRVLGQPDFNSSSSDLAQASMSYPTGLAFDSVGNRLFVGEYYNSRVLVFDVATITNGENAAHVLGQEDFTTVDSITVDADSTSSIFGLTFDVINNRLFVADAHSRVLVFDTASITNGEDAIRVLGQPDFTSETPDTTQGIMNYPTGAAINASGTRLYVTDGTNRRVLIYDIAAITNGENAINVLGQADFTSAASGVSASRGSYFMAASFDATNSYLYVIDRPSNRIVVFSVSAISNGEDAVDVVGQTDSSGNPVFTTSNENNTVFGGEGFDYPSDIVLDTAHHRMFLADSGNERVLVYNLNSANVLVDTTPDYVLGKSSVTATSPSDGQNGLGFVAGITYDTVRNLLFVVDLSSHRVMVFDVASITNGENAVHVLGQANFNDASPDTTQSSFNYPQSAVYDTLNQRLFVADGYNARILAFDLTVITDGENAANVLGQDDFVTSDAHTTQDGLSYYVSGRPAYDSAHNLLYVSDSSNSRVMVFDVASITNGENAVKVLGQPNFTTDTATTTQAGLSYPQSLEFDAEYNRLFVADADNSRVMIFDVSSVDNGENAIGVLGKPDFTTSSGAVSQTNIGYAQSSAFDFDNNQLYVVDSSNNRVLTYNFVTLADASFSGTANSAISTSTPSFSNQQGTVTSAVVSGSLPVGISFNGVSFTGTPTTAGSYSVTIQATDVTDVGSFSSNEATVEFTIAAAPVASVAPATGGGGYAISVPNPTPTVTPSIAPTLASGLQFPPASYLQVPTIITSKLAKTASTATIYRVTENGYKLAFPNLISFTSYGHSFRNVKTISESELTSYPDITFIKLSSAPLVYYLEHNIKHPITAVAAARLHMTETNVHTVSRAHASAYKTAAAILE